MKVNGFIIPVRGNCRARNEERKNFSVLTHVSEHLWNDRIGAYVERSEKAQINNPVMSRDRKVFGSITAGTTLSSTRSVTTGCQLTL